MNDRLTKARSEATIVLASVYLTFFVDTYTINTNLKRVFVFSYFIMISHVLVYLKRRFIQKTSEVKNTAILSALIAAGVVILFHGFFLPTAQESNVSVMAVPNEDGSYGEVWLTSASVDGEEIRLSQLRIDETQGWSYAPEYDDYVFYPQAEGSRENRLTLHAVAERLTLTFGINSWSGKVRVEGADGGVTETVLTSEDSVSNSYTFVQDVRREWSLAAYLFYGLGAVVVVAFLINAVWAKVLQAISSNQSPVARQGVKSSGQMMDTQTVAITVTLGGLLVLLILMLCLMPRVEHSLTLMICALGGLLILESSCVICVSRYHSLRWRNPRATVLSTLLAVFMGLALLNGVPEALYEDQTILIKATTEKNSDAYSNEVWVMEILQDGERLPLKDYALGGWSCQNESVLLYAGESVGGTLSIPLSHPKSATVSFLSHPWSGVAGIDWGDGMEDYDLYSAETEWKNTVISFSPVISVHTYGVLAALCVLSAVIFYLGLILFEQRILGAMFPACLLSAALPLGGWFAHWPHHALFALTASVFLLLVLGGGILQKSAGWIETGTGRIKKGTVLPCVFFSVICLFQAFLWTYNQLALLPFEIRNGPLALGFYGLFVVYVCTGGVVFLTLLKRIYRYREKRENSLCRGGDQHKKKVLFVAVWLLLAVVWMVWWKAYFPANMSPDSIDQWQQAIGVYPLDDAHPLFSTLWVRFCSWLWPSPSMVVLIQILIGAAIYAGMLVSFISRGLTRKNVFLLGIALALLPNVSLYMVTMWKDVPFLLSLSGLAFLMLLVFCQKKLNWKMAALLALVLFAVALWRHNGFLIAGVCGVILIAAALCFRIPQLVAAVLIALVCVQLFNGPLYRILGVEHYDIGLAGVVTDCVGYTIYHNGDIPQDILAEAVKEKSEDFWRENYSPFHAFNYVYNGACNLSSIYADKGLMEQLDIILRLFLHNPQIIFYERMAMNDTNLFVYQAVAENSLNSRYANSIFENNLGG